MRYTVAYQQTARGDRADAGDQTYRDKKISHKAAKSKPTLFHEEQLIVTIQ